MSDLISRQAALTDYQKVCYGIKCIECPLRFKVGERLSDCRLETFIKELPSAQAEIVRCGECANRDKWGCPWWKDEARPDDWYCADGERREE